MRIFTRYMMRRFLGPFLFGLGVFALVTFLGDLFDKMNRIATSSASGPVIAQYLLLQAPYWTIRVVPMATLLATLFAVTGFVASGEAIAVQAAGLRVREFFRPLLGLALVAAAGAFLAQELLVPWCYARAQQLWRERIHPEWEWDKFPDVVLVGGPDRLITTREFLVQAGTMERPVLDDYGPQGLVRQVDAKRARWDAARGRWVFERGVERLFDGPRAASERAFETLESDLDLAPLKLLPRATSPDEMSLAETRAYARRLERLKQSPRRAYVAAHAKLAYPFTNAVLCALGIPIALRLRRARRPVSFGAALVVSFVYLWVIELSLALGNAGQLPPVLAAWLPNLVFAGGATALYRTTEI